MNLRFLTGWVSILLSICLQSCGGEGSSGMQITRGKSMILHFTNDPQGLNPFTSTDAIAAYVENLIFDNLIFLDYKTLGLRPVLAEALPEESADHLSYTFKLRKDARFSDGKPVTADDVVFSFRALMNPFVNSTSVRAEMNNFSDCIKIDNHTVQLLLSKPGPFSLNRLALQFYVLPKHIYDSNSLTDQYTGKEATHADAKADEVSEELKSKLMAFANHFNDTKFAREPGYVVGSGRYIFEKWVTNQQLRLIKNRNYWNTKSSHPYDEQKMDTLIYKIIPDIESALAALKNGEIDFSDQFEPAQFKEKMSGADFDESFTKKLLPYPGYEYIGWNTNIKDHPEKNFFADKRVRWAMSYLIDVDAIINNLAYGTVKPLSSMVYSERPEFNKDIPFIKANEEKAKALLFEAGWIDSDNDGYLDKTINGVKVTFEFTMYYRKGINLRKNIALNLQERFRKAKIKMEPKDMDPSLMTQKLKNHELDAWIAGWAYDSDEQDYYSLFHSSQISEGGYNYSSYLNPEADQLMEDIRVEFDEQARYEKHKRVQQVLYDDQPYTLLFNNEFRVAFNNRLSNSNWYKQRPCYDPGQFNLSKGVKSN